MYNSSPTHYHGPVRCCAICGGKLGLIRYYCWRTALCSKKCLERLKARREADHNWLCWLRAA